ncbi:tRNA pseudouridine(55) synthase TruB [Neptuniibacter sp. CAU 1671]|uniref:tRNA pseudouridine(55) synthase TruB n=1 Tax=Neptuniibacter sp. CAU 1671 TaxID=3032593 RepID=UPI0023D99E22|nr:tRNA pseudouridine(55) synthase TruB [Neptuniibacter sp. CAU 1671]MDF2181209.1 tRNA pseudouridine(55) synthase TruB [Neptuniibacter sp. CAU 1671]
MGAQRKRRGRPVNGVLLLHKAGGISSNAALQQIKRLYQAQKAGHTGALDPLATGMLPICLGEATKFSQYLLDADKVYQTTAKLGVRTDSSDADGQVVEEKPVPENLTAAQIEALLVEHFSGEIEQVPSMFSALKFQGQPLYKLARKGIQVEVKPRRVTIHSIRLTGFRGDELDLEVHCSKGTYIRSIVEDLGLLLGCGAHVTRLHRLDVGAYRAEQMLTLAEIEEKIADFDPETELESIQNTLDALLLPPWAAVSALPEFSLDAQQSLLMQQGQSLLCEELPELTQVRLFTTDGQFLGVAMVEQGRLKPQRLISTTDLQNTPEHGL